MDLTTQEYKRVAVVTVAGRIDSATSSELEAALKALIDKGKKNLILDLAGVDFLSSSGLRVMVNTLKAVKGSGELCLAQPSERVQSSLDIAGVDVLFKVHPTREAAVASF